jgi:hypothetical protein
MSPEPDMLTERSVSLKYEPIPKNKTKAELLQSRRELNSSFDFQLEHSRHDSPEARLFKREEKLRVSPSNTLTLQQLLQKRKLENIEYHSKTFGKVRIGIHKEELPKFCVYRKEYWGESMKKEEKKEENVGFRAQTRTCSSYERELTRKPNEIVPMVDSERQVKYGKRFVLSKVENLVLKYFKIFEGGEEKQKKVKRRFVRENRKVVTPQVQVKHIRSGGFYEVPCVRDF